MKWTLSLLLPLAVACGARPGTAAQANVSTTGTSADKSVWPRLEGTLLVCNQQEASAYLIDLSTGKTARKLKTGDGPHEAAASPDGRWIAVTNYGGPTPGNSLCIVELPKGEVLKTVSLGEYTRPHGIDWLDADRVIVTSETTQNLVIVNVRKGEVERALPTGFKGSHMLALTKDKKRVFSGNIPAGNVTAIDLTSHKSLGTATALPGCEGIAVSPDGKWIWTSNRGPNHSLSVIDAHKLEKVKDIPSPGLPYRVTFSPDGKHVLAPHPPAGEVVVFDAQKMEVHKRIDLSNGDVTFNSPTGKPGPVGIVVHPAGRYAFASVHQSFAIAVIDLQAGRVVAKAEAGKSPDGLCISPIKLSGPIID